MGVDVVIPTWNSGKTLESCLIAIRASLHVDNIFVVDRESQDATRSIATQYGCHILTDTISLGSARMKGIMGSSAEFILFIDDDIIVDHTLNDIFPHMDVKTGAVQGFAVPKNEFEREASMRHFQRRMSDRPFLPLTMNERGYTNATLVRRELLLDLDISKMNAYEDWVISRHIIRKGFLWKLVPIYVLHDHLEERRLFKCAWNAAGLLNMSKRGEIPFPDMFAFYMRMIYGEVKKAMLYVENGNYAGLRYSLTALIGDLLGPFYNIIKVKRKAIKD